MSNLLKNIAKYSTDRISLDKLSFNNYVSTENLAPNKNGKSDAEKLPPNGNLVTKYDKGDILIANIRPYLKKIWFATNSGGSSSDVLTLKINPIHCSKFVYYSLFRDEFFDYVMAGSKGTKMPRGDKNQVLNFPIPSFSYEKQTQIAKVLSDLDAKIELNNKINTELEAMAKLIYDYWFVQFEFPDEDGKPYKSSGGKMVWNEELKRAVPEGWEVGCLLDIATFTNGLACQKFRPKQNEEFYRVIKIREMSDGFTANSEFVTQKIPEKVVIMNGDILFSWSATLDVKIWTRGIGALNQHIFKVTSDKYPRSYFYFELLNYLEHFKMIAELRKTTMGHITQDHLKQSRIPIPSIELTNILHEKINPILKKIILLKEENQKLAELRDWLLPMLMNGQVQVVNQSEYKMNGEIHLAAEDKERYE